MPGRLAFSIVCAATGLALTSCGSEPATPTPVRPPVVVVGVPTPAPTPTPSNSATLPSGMVCGAPTPPPLLRMHVKVHTQNDNRTILDSKPVVVSVDGYCDKVGFGDWKFCDTRPEGHPERVACDYLVTGKAEDTARWGPTWFFGNDLCSFFPDSCANHSDNQFLAVGRAKGVYEACASEDWPVAAEGSRCGTLELK